LSSCARHHLRALNSRFPRMPTLHVTAAGHPRPARVQPAQVCDGIRADLTIKTKGERHRRAQRKAAWVCPLAVAPRSCDSDTRDCKALSSVLFLSMHGNFQLTVSPPVLCSPGSCDRDLTQRVVLFLVPPPFFESSLFPCACSMRELFGGSVMSARPSKKRALSASHVITLRATSRRHVQVEQQQQQQQRRSITSSSCSALLVPACHKPACFRLSQAQEQAKDKPGLFPARDKRAHKPACLFQRDKRARAQAALFSRHKRYKRRTSRCP
jgi:hypothetical protein